MNLPTLNESDELLQGCIRSCNTIPQLSTCREMIDTFIRQRYQHYESSMDIARVLSELDGLIEETAGGHGSKKIRSSLSHIAVGFDLQNTAFISMRAF